MAERVGFEPTVGVNLPTLSKRAPYTARPPLEGRKRPYQFNRNSPFPHISATSHILFPLLNCHLRFRDSAIGSTSAFGAESPGSSPGPGTKLFPAPSQRRDG